MPARPSQLTRVRRLPERAAYDEQSVAAVLDAGFVCHVGVLRGGRPVVVPTLYARDGARLLLHGSTAAGVFRDLGRDDAVCVTVTLVDGLVLARSAFHHSVNYRSVVVHGRARQLTDVAEKAAALQVLVEHLAPGRWDATRQPSTDELRQTGVWAVGLTDASVKVRSGPPKDDEADLSLDVWAGVLPLSLATGTPIPDEHVPADRTPPAHVTGWSLDG